MHLHPKEVFVLYFGVMAVLVVRRRLALTNIPPKCLQLKLYHMACAWEGESDGQNLAVNRLQPFGYRTGGKQQRQSTALPDARGSRAAAGEEAAHVLPCPTVCTAAEWDPALLDLHALPEKSLSAGRQDT